MDWWGEDPGRTSDLNEYEICPKCDHLFSECDCEYVEENNTSVEFQFTE